MTDTTVAEGAPRAGTSRDEAPTPRVGVILPDVPTQQAQRLDLATAARHAEDAGLDSVWHGDHLAVGAPTLDCAVALAAAAAATTRVQVGTSVLVPALRPLVWAAKQIASLQHVSGGRLVVGVGSGAAPAGWAAAGVPYGSRGQRTDTALELLPSLLAGAPVRLVDEPGQPEVELAPAVPSPPFWIGNASAVAIRRAARLGDGWFPSVRPMAELRSGAARLAELAAGYGRAVPTVIVGVAAAIGAGAGVRDRIAAELTEAYGIPADQAQQIPMIGPPSEAAARLRDYRDLGVTHVVVGFTDGDWRRQCDLLAEARAHLG